jgi:hypothetical protein
VGTILRGSIAVKLAADGVDLVEGSGTALVVEGSAPLKPGTESGVEINGGAEPRRLRGRVVSCEVVGISPLGPRYRIALTLNKPFDFPPRAEPTDSAVTAPSLLSVFGFLNLELEEPDPALAANSW